MISSEWGLRSCRRLGAAMLLAASWALAPHVAGAQSIVMAGSYQNFDVLNNTGGTVYGFEMEVYGVSKSQLTRIFPSNFPNLNVIRYGVGTATDFPGGVRVRWAANYDPATGQYSTQTGVPPSLTSVPGDSCWTIGMPGTYATAGCEHFGISTAYVNPTQINYYWLVDDPNNHGSLIPNSKYVNLPAPVWSAIPPANPGLAPVVVAEVQAPPAPPARFGDAQWVKVYKVEQQGKVDLNELVGDNHAVVPENAAQLETSWSLLQADPAAGGGQRRRGKLANQGGVGNGNHAVVRRYEYYQYAGAYDPITHEALCADLTCTAPSPGELGDAIGAQNAAANLDINALTVSVTGGGSVSSADKVFSCGNKCYGVYAQGATVTLTAKANSGSTFTSWGGACAGNVATCTVSMGAEKTVTALFTTVAAGGGGGGGGGGASQFKVSVSRSNTGTVLSNLPGINCGNNCSANFAANSLITLTATPPAGLAFLGWSGACTGTSPVCNITLTKDSSVVASFSK